VFLGDFIGVENVRVGEIRGENPWGKTPKNEQTHENPWGKPSLEILDTVIIC
jgi:hypothetical protein